jgi:hypothetical protein
MGQAIPIVEVETGQSVVIVVHITKTLQEQQQSL